MSPLLHSFTGMRDMVCGGVDDLPWYETCSDALELMELPHLLGLSAKELSASPYLHVPAALSNLLDSRMGNHSKTRIGVVWTGSAYDPERWIPIEALTVLFENHSFEWWNVQAGATGTSLIHRNLKQAADALPTPHLDSYCALLQNLDLVITTDTLAAHLAGAMGKPVWVLLKRDADWRWMRNRCDSPWYPSARLFRQTSSGDWTGVLDAVKRELNQL